MKTCTVNSNLERLRNVSIAGVLMIVIFLFIALLGDCFDWVRVIPCVVLLLILATAVAGVALGQSLRVSPSGQKKLLLVVVCVSLGLRGVALFTSPILEVDFYRHLWDGKVLAKGISPYAYSPAQVLDTGGAYPDPSYQKIVALAIQTDSNYTILRRVHFAQYTSIYPPVSQCVFAVAMKWFPAEASVWSHVIFMKLVLVGFDLLTIVVLLKLLTCQGLAHGWLIAYAWNPLVIKEVANSGHLDSIAVFFLVAAMYCAAIWLKDSKSTKISWPLWLCGLSLSLGFGAKLFPIVLVPLFAVAFAKNSWSSTIKFLIAFAVPAAGITLGLIQSLTHREQVQRQIAVARPAQQSTEGLSGFLTKWRMNDVIFSGIYRNLKPNSKAGSTPPWYVLTTNDSRIEVQQWFRQRSIGGADPAFFMTRLTTVAVFGGVYFWILMHTFRSRTLLPIENFTWILTLFLFLQPTVNPWYWLWVAPLTCFAKSKGWLVVSGLLMIYYLRFWFLGLPGGYTVGSKSYTGVDLFDHGLAWLEFTAIVLVVAWIGLHGSAQSALETKNGV